MRRTALLLLSLACEFSEPPVEVSSTTMVDMSTSDHAQLPTTDTRGMLDLEGSSSSTSVADGTSSASTTGSADTDTTAASSSRGSSDATTSAPCECSDYSACDPIVCDGMCVIDDIAAPGISVCTRPCRAAAECPPAPGGTAPVTCEDVTGDGVPECVLDCSGAGSCPEGMTCHASTFCVWPQ